MTEKLIYYKRKNGVELHIIYTGNVYTSFGCKTGDVIISLSNSDKPIILSIEDVAYLKTVLDMFVREVTEELQAAHTALTQKMEKDDDRKTDVYIK